MRVNIQFLLKHVGPTFYFDYSLGIQNNAVLRHFDIGLPFFCKYKLPANVPKKKKKLQYLIYELY